MSRVHKYEHITPVLASVRWLLISQCIEYKLVLITFKSLHEIAPDYLEEVPKWHQAPRTLRSPSLEMLQLPRTRLKYYGDEELVITAPSLWNAPPHQFRQMSTLAKFKSAPKTHLFKVAFS